MGVLAEGERSLAQRTGISGDGWDTHGARSFSQAPRLPLRAQSGKDLPPRRSDKKRVQGVQGSRGQVK